MPSTPSPQAPRARDDRRPGDDATDEASTPTLLDRLGGWLGWALAAALVLMQFVDLRSGIHGHPAVVSAYLIGFALLTVVTLPFWALRRSETTRTGRVVLAGFALLLAWALVTTLTEHVPLIYLLRRTAKGTWFTTATVGRSYYVVPVLTSVFTFVSAWGLALALPRGRRPRVLWVASLALALSTLLAWPRSALANHSVRLATGLGGAAVVHVALLLALGQLLGAALAGERRLWSWLGALICAVAILLTGSRAGLICLAAFVVLLALWSALRGQGRLAVPLVGGLLLLVVAVVAFVPAARHLVQGSDAGRAANASAAADVFTHSAHNLLLGTGSGRVWPWYPFETGRLPVPWEQFIKTDGGLLHRTMTSPHSLLLAVFVELGLLGGLLLLAVLAAVVVHVLRMWRASASEARTPAQVREIVGLLAVVATLPAFLFDTYLLKNFGVSFWWWVVVALTVGVRRGGGAGVAHAVLPTGRIVAAASDRPAAQPPTQSPTQPDPVEEA